MALAYFFLKRKRTFQNSPAHLTLARLLDALAWRVVPRGTQGDKGPLPQGACHQDGWTGLRFWFQCPSFPSGLGVLLLSLMEEGR